MSGRKGIQNFAIPLYRMTRYLTTLVQKNIMDLQQEFEAAAAASKTLPSKPDNETLLKLYSLYKQGNEGDINGEAPSNPFDFVAKAKYQAWEELKGKSTDAAKQEYIQLVNKLQGK
jgi:acyl-CoA-binding protein